MKKLLLIGSLALGGAAWVGGGTALAQKQAPDVALDMATARQIALEKVAGEVVEEELETEDGRWVYSFEILEASGVEWEIEVDANTGVIVEIEEDD